MKRTLLALLFSAPVLAVAAPAISKVTAVPSPAVAGQPVKVTVEGADADDSPCGLVVHWDDGTSESPQKVGGKWPKLPRDFQHTYGKPGEYIVKAEGANAGGSFFACMGSATLTVKVEAAAAAAKGPACPDNWKLSGKPGKDGSFACTPKAKGAKKPDQPLACPAGTSYFVSNTKLGCEKAN